MPSACRCAPPACRCIAAGDRGASGLGAFAGEEGSPATRSSMTVSRSVAWHGMAWEPPVSHPGVAGAVLQVLTWLAAAPPLPPPDSRGAMHSPRARWRLRRRGLVVYGSYLGSDGEVYRWLRRWAPCSTWRNLSRHAAVRAGIATLARSAPACPAAHPRQRDSALMSFIAVLALCQCSLRWAVRGS